MKSSQRKLPSIILSLIVLNAGAAVRYVNVNSANPASPYTNWATAATTIQQAIDVALAGDEILVTNGVYQTGATAVYGMSNRVAVTKPVTVRSVNGPAHTSIVGFRHPGTTTGASAIRCAYLTNGAVLSGFTLTNGATQRSGDDLTRRSGGGVWCESASAVVTNCTLMGNSAYIQGGGAARGTLNNCTVMGNSAQQASGGGAYNSTLNNCVLTSNSAYSGGGAYLGTLNNCTLTRNSASNFGGGTFQGVLNNCTLTGNSASFGGGASGGALNNCTLTGNSASSGGGASGSTVNNCTLTGNSADSGGGVSGGNLTNCIVYYNAASSGVNYTEGTLFSYCSTTPMPIGPGNLAEEPQLASASHLNAGSSCIGRGSAASARGVDMDGEPWANPPSIGSDEFWSGSVTGDLSVDIMAAHTNVTVGFAVDLKALIEGRLSASRWDFGDGNAVSNRPYASHAWAVAGDYVVELRAYNESYPAGVAATVTVRVMARPIHYVALSSANSVPPYDSWATAATNIQDAVDAATLAGALVLVSNGVYQTGARSVYGTSNRLAVTKPITVQSVNGPTVTEIRGYRAPGTTNGPAAIRCVYLANEALLAGFTLSNGSTRTSGNSNTNRSGGGVWCEGMSAVVSNCVFTGNSASFGGGGAYRGTLNNCLLKSNSSTGGGGGGASSATLNHCVVTNNSANSGGGVYTATLNNCVVTSNSAGSGGGAYSATLNHCVVTSNSAGSGGGAYAGTLNDCTIANNSADSGGGANSSTLNRCVVTSNSAGTGGGAYAGTLNDCTIANNSTDSRGGGAAHATLSNCTLTSNSARYFGGGAYYGTLNNCTITDNSAESGGGAISATLNNCTLTSNSADSGGGAYTCVLNNCTLTGNSANYKAGGAFAGTMNNCIVYYNTARVGDNYIGGALNYCCTTPLPASGAGNISAEPQLASVSHLSAGSPCRGAGSAAYATGLDLDGEPWANPPSIGCDEYWSGSQTGGLSVAIVAAYTNVAVGFGVDFQAMIEGSGSASSWDFGDGNVVSNRPYALHAWAAAGVYVVELRAYNESHPTGVAATVSVHVVQEEHYVALTSINPVPPYSSWATAATSIQHAVDVATLPGALVLVNDGMYQTGARAVYGMSNRVAVTKPVRVQSVNGSAVTQIVGHRVPGTTNGPAAVRCVYLTSGAVLSGFTLTNGATQTSGDFYTNQSGGGVWCEGTSAVLSNCVITGNSARYGGGSYFGTLINCTLNGNSATRGGGAYGGTLNNCTLTGNSAPFSGDGGGAYDGTLNNCTLTGNSAGNGSGACRCTLNNCIVYYNPTLLSDFNHYQCAFNYSCTTPLPPGRGNLDSVPSFVNTTGWSDLRLQSNSSCINSGNNAYVPGHEDLNGNARVVGGTVDMGAYEFQTPASAISYAWLQQYGLPTDGSADLADSDGEGMNNWQEWRAGTVPTNALSALRMLSLTGSASGITLRWESVDTRTYRLERATNLAPQPVFSIIAPNLPGQAGTTTYTDTNATVTGPSFYRVGVQP